MTVRHKGRILILMGLGWLALLVAIIPGASGAQARLPGGAPVQTSASQPVGYAGGVPIFQAQTGASEAHPPRITAVNLDMGDNFVDLGKLGIHPTARPMIPHSYKNTRSFNPLDLILPDGGAIGTQNAYMVASPDVVSQSIA